MAKVVDQVSEHRFMSMLQLTPYMLSALNVLSLGLDAHLPLNQVQPLCVKYEWTVPVCEECSFQNAGIYGMNVNRGQKILLRLRESEHRGGGFLQYDSVLGTMLHELSHNRHSNHSSDFYKLLDTLRDECEQLIGDGITGQRSDHQYTMHSSS